MRHLHWPVWLTIWFGWRLEHIIAKCIKRWRRVAVVCNSICASLISIWACLAECWSPISESWMNKGAGDYLPPLFMEIIWASALIYREALGCLAAGGVQVAVCDLEPLNLKPKSRSCARAYFPSSDAHNHTIEPLRCGALLWLTTKKGCRFSYNTTATTYRCNMPCHDTLKSWHCVLVGHKITMSTSLCILSVSCPTGAVLSSAILILCVVFVYFLGA